MKMTLTVFHQDTGARLYADTYHLPNDVAAWLNAPTPREGPRSWGGSSPHDMHLYLTGDDGNALDPLRLEYRWTAHPCHCVSCSILASAGSDSRGPR